MKPWNSRWVTSSLRRIWAFCKKRLWFFCKIEVANVIAAFDLDVVRDVTRTLLVVAQVTPRFEEMERLADFFQRCRTAYGLLYRARLSIEGLGMRQVPYDLMKPVGMEPLVVDRPLFLPRGEETELRQGRKFLIGVSRRFEADELDEEFQRIFPEAESMPDLFRHLRGHVLLAVDDLLEVIRAVDIALL